MEPFLGSRLTLQLQSGSAEVFGDTPASAMLAKTLFKIAYATAVSPDPVRQHVLETQLSGRVSDLVVFLLRRVTGQRR